MRHGKGATLEANLNAELSRRMAAINAAVKSAPGLLVDHDEVRLLDWSECQERINQLSQSPSLIDEANIMIYQTHQRNLLRKARLEHD